jgi:hypothetical protein
MPGPEQRTVRRVVVLSSSIGLVVRPPGAGVTYPRLLERALNEAPGTELWLVENLSEVAAIVDDLGGLVRRVTALQPDVIVLQYGRVEALRRPHSRAFWLRTYLRRPDLSAREQLVRTFVNRPYSALRHHLHLRRQWSPLPRFERILDRGLTFLGEETQAALFVLEATPVTPRVEQYGPGSIAALAGYNEVLHRLAARHGAELVTLADLHRRDPELVDLDRLTPDGTHFSAQAHVAVAGELCARIEALRAVQAP